MDAILDKLNPQQRDAATAPLDRPVLVVAGAGTGKTNTLAHRVAHLIATGTDPSRILLLTFTRRAAAEMTRRARSILNRHSALPRLWAGTFHAIANRIFHRHRPLGRRRPLERRAG
jgi:DNA helicase-2/ATP-dependent DNA helicase PcrA